MFSNHYETLGVAENAGIDEIKKAYRNLAKKYHPDAGGCSDQGMFEKINEAYETLSDPNAKARYDASIRPSFTFVRTSFGPSHVNARVSIGLDEARKGCERKIKYQRIQKCAHCGGTGAEDGVGEMCPDCHGRGILTGILSAFGLNGGFPCGRCGGTGRIIKNPCPHCQGGFVVAEAEADVKIPAGIVNGQCVNIWGLGHENARNETGALRVTVFVSEKWNGIRRDPVGRYVYDLEIGPVDAVLGGTFAVPWFDGPVEVAIEPGTQPGQEILALQEGPLLVKVSVKTSKPDTDAERALWESLRALGTR